jgi:hypothetical protein
MEIYLDSIQKLLTSGVENLPTQDLPIRLLTATFFGFVLNQLYALYYRDNEAQDGSLARGLVMLTPALTMTFMLIQASIALSLGLLGSLSFVRFRAQVKRTEDVCFVIIAIAVAIACSAKLFLAALVLVSVLFAYSYLRNKIAQTSTRNRFAIVTLNTKTTRDTDTILTELSRLGVRPEFISMRTYDGISSLVFNLGRVEHSQHSAIARTLTAGDESAQLNIFYPSERLGA